MNPSTAFAAVLVDELIRCGLTGAVVAPGSRSAPLAMALHDRADAGPDARGGPAGQSGAGPGGAGLRLHVRIDERSAAFLALGLAKASGVPSVVVCTSGTAAANLHPAVVEADEACVPLIVLTADRPPELRGTGANQAIDQIKLFGGAVRWFCETGVPQQRAGMAAYWRSLACQAWGQALGGPGGPPGPVHLNVPLAEPLVPDGDPGWCEPLEGRTGGAPWTRIAIPGPAGAALAELPAAERGVLIAADGDYDPGPLLALAEARGWPVLAEPSSNARNGPNALSAYPYLLGTGEFVSRHRPEVIVSAGKPGLSRQQIAFLRESTAAGARHVVMADRTGRWADPARTASSVIAHPASGVSSGGGVVSDGAAVPGAMVPYGPGSGGVAVSDGLGSGGAAVPKGAAVPGGAVVTGWLMSWLTADAAARAAVDAILDAEPRAGAAGASGAAADPGAGAELSEPRLARDLAAALPDGALLWAASSLPIRDLDQQMPVRSGLRVLANRGASGIDGLVSASVGAALAHQRSGGGPAAALLGDLALLHDMGGLVLGPDEPRPDLAIVIASNDGGGIFSLLEQASFPASFERVFGTPHGVDLGAVAHAVGLAYTRLERPADLRPVLAASAPRGSGLQLIEVPTSREAGTRLRHRLRDAAAAAVRDALARAGS